MNGSMNRSESMNTGDTMTTNASMTRNIIGWTRKHLPDAVARVTGRISTSGPNGWITLYQTPWGVLMVVDVQGLPDGGGAGIFALHIHEGGSCASAGAGPFSAAGEHYNPDGYQHPWHRGDLPPLFSCGGTAWLCVLTDRFGVEEVIDRTVVIHENPDDFTSQPSGNAGEKIACGVIKWR